MQLQINTSEPCMMAIGSSDRLGSAPDSPPHTIWLIKQLDRDCNCMTTGAEVFLPFWPFFFIVVSGTQKLYSLVEGGETPVPTEL